MLKLLLPHANLVGRAWLALTSSSLTSFEAFKCSLHQSLHTFVTTKGKLIGYTLIENAFGWSFQRWMSEISDSLDVLQAYIADASLEEYTADGFLSINNAKGWWLAKERPALTQQVYSKHPRMTLSPECAALN